MNRLTVCLLNWRRPKDVDRIIDSLRQQSEKVDIFLWDNADPDNAITKDRECDWVIESSLNKRCWPRWFMASQASSEYVMSLDDDLMHRICPDLAARTRGLPDNDALFKQPGHWDRRDMAVRTFFPRHQ